MTYACPVGLSVLAGSLAAVVAYSGAYVSVGGSLLALVQDVFLFLWAVAIANVSREPALLRAVTRAWAISSTFWAAVSDLRSVRAYFRVVRHHAENRRPCVAHARRPEPGGQLLRLLTLVLRAAQVPAAPRAALDHAVR